MMIRKSISLLTVPRAILPATVRLSNISSIVDDDSDADDVEVNTVVESRPLVKKSLNLLFPFRVVEPGYSMVIATLGHIRGTRNSGCRLVIPCLDLLYLVDTRDQVIKNQRQSI